MCEHSKKAKSSQICSFSVQGNVFFLKMKNIDMYSYAYERYLNQSVSNSVKQWLKAYLLQTHLMHAMNVITNKSKGVK